MASEIVEHGVKQWPGVSLTRREVDSFVNWLNHHKLTCKEDRNIVLAFGGHSGIGTNVVIKCGCGAGSDVTDYGSW